MNRPMFDMLYRASLRRSLHMPGHKGRAPFGTVDPYALDTTELPVTDDFYAAERGIKRAQELYAQAAGSAETLFLHGGSSVGIHAMLQLYAGEGDAVLLPRNAHLSAVNGCALGGIRAEWMPVTQRRDGWCCVDEETVLTAICRHPDAKAVLITRPDYFGACLPLERIVKAAGECGMRVIVDEAHGAHLPWLDGVSSAGAYGADAWVQSAHKTLMGFTGSAVLHLSHAEDARGAMRVLRREQTSSPSFLLMLSIDDSRAWMEEKGTPRLRELTRGLDGLRRELPALGYRDAHTLWRDTGLDFDPTRLVIDAPQGGYALAEALAEHGIDVEMADDRRAVLIFTAMDAPEDLDALKKALQAIPPSASRIPEPTRLSGLPEKRMEIREAVMGACESVPLGAARGRVAAQSAGLYPPGVPLVCPGEVISEDTVALLSGVNAERRFGVEGDGLLCVKQ